MPTRPLRRMINQRGQYLQQETATAVPHHPSEPVSIFAWEYFPRRDLEASAINLGVNDRLSGLSGGGMARGVGGVPATRLGAMSSVSGCQRIDGATALGFQRTRKSA